MKVVVKVVDVSGDFDKYITYGLHDTKNSQIFMYIYDIINSLLYIL